MKRILILGGKPIGSVEIVKRAKELGYYTIVTDYLPRTESPAKQIADETWDISTADVANLAQMCEEHHVDGVTTGVHEFNINRMLDLCELINKPCYCNRDTWKYCGNKVEFKNLCIENDIPVAQKYDIHNLGTLPYPVITKPIDGSGSRGFHICQNAEELKVAFADAMNFSPGKHVLIEDYIPYDAVIIHYTMDNGKCIYSGMSDKISVKFKNTGSSVMGIQTFPSKGEEIFLTHLNDKVCAMFENAGFTDGPIWIEAFFNGADKFIFNEMGYRFGGSLTYYPVKYFHQINQLDTLIYNAMGDPCKEIIQKDKPDSRKYCILPIHTKAGIINRVVGEEAIKNRLDVYAYVPVHFQGDIIKDWGSAQQVFCYIHILYNSPKDLKLSIKEIMQQLQSLDERGRNLLFTLFDIDNIPDNE